ncbi:hypothetical protein [Pedobacter sp. ASV28]|uniref:hypothetical protein n=1 Tax=Pedobacter sp. ASV28 TaxID=2795123 RepID=UPI0018EE1A18|nr:hypothetical protein [Pedobacter sp. ASV28]
MKKIIITTLLSIAVNFAFAQNRENNHSVWRDSKNGITYQMEISSTLVKVGKNEKPHVSFSVIGDIGSLQKLTFTRKNELQVNLTLEQKPQDIMVEPGLYTFKLYHQKLGQKEFDIELKKGEDKKVVLTLK